MSSRVDVHFGELTGHPVGSTYAGRKEAMHAGLHRNWVPGISAHPDHGADCIALNRGYVDDEDHGDWILYTGAGGNDPSTKRQIANQNITHRDNAALVYSEINGLPVRVLRGPKGEKPYAPASGYRYDGLYKIIRHWAEVGHDGFRIWRFRLVRLTPEEARPWTPLGQGPALGRVDDAKYPIEAGRGQTEFEPSADGPATSGGSSNGAPEGNAQPGRAEGIVQRIVRSTKVSQHVKELYGHRCQICRATLSLPVGQYSEGAHIRGIGSPHDGPDTLDNLLCLCPNDHVLFDKGAIYVDEGLMVYRHDGTQVGLLTTHPKHSVSAGHLRYHRAHHGFVN